MSMVQGNSADDEPLSGHPVMWKPIESAPRDGRDFLVYIAHGYVTRGRYMGGKAFSCDSFGATVSGDDTNPTHWMPLPAPPNSAAR